MYSSDSSLLFPVSLRLFADSAVFKKIIFPGQALSYSQHYTVSSFAF